MARAKLTREQRVSLEDALAPHDLTPALAGAIANAVRRYADDIQRERRWIRARAEARRAWALRIELAEELRELSADDANFQMELDERIQTWRRLLEVSGNTKPIDGALWWLGVRVVAACAAAGVELETGRATTIVEVLHLVREWGKRAAGVPITKPASGWAKDSVDRYRVVISEGN